MTWLQLGVLFFLVSSLVFYAILAGADFGAGILELFLGRERHAQQRRLIERAVAPVWEANHIWLILAVVVLFVGFPTIYTMLSVHLYIPILCFLMGVVGRGCAFTFRHYDSLDASLFRIYSRIFSISSLWSTFFLGVICGAVTLGKISPSATDFSAAYLAPWFNVFCLSVGILTISLFSFLAAVYLVGEAETEQLTAVFLRKAHLSFASNLVAGVLVFATAEYEGHSLFQSFFGNWVSIACFALATALLLPFWKLLSVRGTNIRARFLGAAMVTLVILGWTFSQLPYAIRFAGDSGLTFAGAAANPATLRALLFTLCAGCVLIFPALAFLMIVFKWETFDAESPREKD